MKLQTLFLGLVLIPNLAFSDEMKAVSIPDGGAAVFYEEGSDYYILCSKYQGCARLKLKVVD